VGTTDSRISAPRAAVRRPETVTGLEHTLRAAHRWIAALPANPFDLRLVDAARGTAMLRRFDPEQLQYAVPWMRRMTAAGSHIYARPLARRPILIDERCEDAITCLRAEHAVATVVETSPHNFQAWVTIGLDDPDSALASAVARRLAAAFGGDPGAANHAQVGRLPGFTNRVWKYERKNATYPWVLLHHARACLDPNGGDLLRADAVAPSLPSHAPGPPPFTRSLRARTGAAEHAASVAALRARLPSGAVLDRSRADHAIAVRLLRRDAPMPFVAAVLRVGEKAVGLADGQASGDYAARTLAAALRSTMGLITPRAVPGKERSSG